MKPTHTILAIFFICTASFAQNNFEVSSLFGAQMILPFGHEFRINGTGTKADKITIEITFLNKVVKKVAKVNKQGQWYADFDALPANVSCDMRIYNKSKVLDWKNIKTGEVWLIMGGSNTVQLLGKADLYKEELQQNICDQVSTLIIPRGTALRPQEIPAKSSWMVHNESNLAQIPSIAYYMGSTLARETKSPIGIVNCGYGGSIVETWMSAQELGYSNKELTRKNIENKKTHSTHTVQHFENRFPYPVSIDLFNEDRSKLSAPAYDDSEWEETYIPETFEEKGWADFDGVIWYRKEVEIPAGVSIQKINMGYVDDSDELYVNGKYVGGIEDGYGIPRIYDIPENTIHPGTNTIAVRVRDIGGGGGIYGDPSNYNLLGDGISIGLAGNWKHRVIALETDVDMNDIKRPGMVYNQMVHPLQHFPFKGVIWYQGEVEALELEDFTAYRTQLKKMISGYRRNFNHAQLPFIMVQLPSYGEPDTSFQSWVDFRAAQQKVVNEMENVEIISINELINENNKLDIHISKHKTTGERLAKTALKTVYNSESGALCPTFLNYEKREDGIVLHFKNAETIKSNDDYGYVKGFEISGSNNAFEKVQAKIIHGNSIQINYAKSSPIIIRYCGKSDARDGNVYNQDNMPLMPFKLEIPQTH